MQSPSDERTTIFPLAGTGQLLCSLAQSNQKPRPTFGSWGAVVKPDNRLRNSLQAQQRIVALLFVQTVLGFVKLSVCHISASNVVMAR
jgi:hypothetical protein